MTFTRTLKAQIVTALNLPAQVWNQNRQPLTFSSLKSRVDHPYRLNVGCGQTHFPRWINIDSGRETLADVHWNAARRFPLPAESCQYIYNEHFLEHLPVPTAIAFLTECHRLLRPGGVLRVAMPHVAASVHRYLREDWKNDPAIEKYGLTWIQTRAEMINVSFRYWGHQWLYDEEELERRLREAGFGKLSIVSWGESAHAELQNRETREESRLVCEATKE